LHIKTFIMGLCNSTELDDDVNNKPNENDVIINNKIKTIPEIYSMISSLPNNKKYVLLKNDIGDYIICSYTNKNTTTKILIDAIYDFLKTDKKKYFIYFCDFMKRDISQYQYIDDIFKNLQKNKMYKKKCIIPQQYQDRILKLTYKIKENYNETYKNIIKSINKKYKEHETFQFNIQTSMKENISLKVTSNFTIDEIKFLIYKKENIAPHLQKIINEGESYLTSNGVTDFNKTQKYVLYFNHSISKIMFSPIVCGIINYDNIMKRKVDIDLDEEKNDYSLEYDMLEP
jgi:hypothetical protein